jgi:hypothetical protein
MGIWPYRMRRCMRRMSIGTIVERMVGVVSSWWLGHVVRRQFGS